VERPNLTEKVERGISGEGGAHFRPRAQPGEGLRGLKALP